LLVAWFHAGLDARLAALHLPADVLASVEAERGKLAAAEFPGNVDPALAARLRLAFDEAFVSAFRVLMLGCAVLSAMGAGTALLLVEPRRVPEGGRRGAAARPGS
jgi:hypothetical protein